jgi:hypothetical protein
MEKNSVKTGKTRWRQIMRPTRLYVFEPSLASSSADRKRETTKRARQRSAPQNGFSGKKGNHEKGEGERVK